MAGSSSGTVAGLTVAALATVGVLGFRAAANVPEEAAGTHAALPPAAVASKAPRDSRNPAALPAGSGRGERVVYSVDDDRVWLVNPGGRPKRTFTVHPGTVDPAPGTYYVTSRANSVTGTDGTPIEHVVRFTSTGGLAIGFSAAVNGAAPDPHSAVQTGGIRESRADGEVMWEFATIGQKIVVIR